MAAFRYRRAAAITLIGGVIFALGASGALHPVTAPLTSALAWVEAPLYRIGTALQRAQSAVVGAEQEASRVEELTVELAELRTLESENAALKEALDYRDDGPKDNALLAKVLSRTDEDTFRGFVIDKGADDGIAVGMPVITGSGIIVGKVDGVRSRTASVMLLLDSRSRLAVTVQNGKGTVGVLEGDRGLAMTITLIPLTESLTPGQTVVTSGLEPGIRRGLVVGTLERVDRDAQDPFQTAAVTPIRSASLPVYVQVLRATTGSGEER